MQRECQADFLFDRKWLVWVPYYAIADRVDLEYYGVAGHYDKEGLNRLISSDTAAKIPLSRMAELINDGVGVAIEMTPNEIAQAYNAITTHIENWLWIGNAHGWFKLPPLEDLLAFDALAKHFYDLIDFVEPQNTLGLDGFSGLMNNKSEPTIKPPYHSYADVLIERCSDSIFGTNH